MTTSILWISCPDAGAPIAGPEDAISKKPRQSKSATDSSRYRAENSVGYVIRATQLTFAKYLRNRLQPHKGGCPDRC